MQRIFLPRQIGSSLQFQAKAPEAVPAEAADAEANKEKPAAAEAVGSATEIEVGKVPDWCGV